MAIHYSQVSPFVQELRKWEWRPTMYQGETMLQPLPVEQGGRGLQGYNPSEHPYPKSLYRAKRATGGPFCDLLSDGCITVQNEAEEATQRGQGYHPSQQEAIDAVHAQDLMLAKEAAQINHRDRTMTAKAKAEAQAVKEQHARHLGEIPETPIRRRQPRTKKGSAR